MAVDLTSQTETLPCIECGVPIVLSIGRARQLRDNGAFFYCVNGHPQHFTDTTRSKLKAAEREVDRLKRILVVVRQERDSNMDLWLAEERTTQAYRMNLGKARKRAERLAERVRALETELAATRAGCSVEPAKEAADAG